MLYYIYNCDMFKLDNMSIRFCWLLWNMLKLFVNNISSYFEAIKYVIEALKIESYHDKLKNNIMKARLNELFWPFFFIGRRASLFRFILMWLVSHTPSCCFFLGLARWLSFYRSLSSLCVRSSFLSCVALWLAFNDCLVFIFLDCNSWS